MEQKTCYDSPVTFGGLDDKVVGKIGNVTLSLLFLKASYRVWNTNFKNTPSLLLFFIVRFMAFGYLFGEIQVK